MILATDSAGKSGGETTVSLPCGAPAVTVGLKVRASGALRPKYTPGWREKLGDPIIADAICDRIVHDSYTIVIDCKDSMRKRKGISEN